MKFQVERDVLAEAVGWASRALPARPVIPVLSGLLLQAADGLTLSCFDYEVSARVEVDADVAEPGTVLVPGRLLAEITRSLPSLPVEFADDPEGVSLTCGSASFTLVTLPVEEYPDAAGAPAYRGDGRRWRAGGGHQPGGAGGQPRRHPAPADRRQHRGRRRHLTLAATDRYRLAVRELPWQPASDGPRGGSSSRPGRWPRPRRTMTPGVPVTIS